jgi:anti-sigma B factor antagonist
VRGATEFGLLEEPIDENTHIVAPAGEIDALTAPQLGSRLLGLADDGKTGVVVDLTRVTFMDSTGIGVILNALRALGARSATLVLVCPTERIMRPFEVTGLTNRLPIVKTLDDALGSLGAA